MRPFFNPSHALFSKKAAARDKKAFSACISARDGVWYLESFTSTARKRNERRNGTSSASIPGGLGVCLRAADLRPAVGLSADSAGGRAGAGLFLRPVRFAGPPAKHPDRGRTRRKSGGRSFRGGDRRSTAGPNRPHEPEPGPATSVGFGGVRAVPNERTGPELSLPVAVFRPDVSFSAFSKVLSSCEGGAGRGMTAAGLSAARIRPDRVRVPRVAVSAA